MAALTITIIVITKECPDESMSWPTEVAHQALSMPLASPHLSRTKQGQLINRTVNARGPIMCQALG